MISTEETHSKEPEVKSNQTAALFQNIFCRKVLPLHSNRVFGGYWTLAGIWIKSLKVRRAVYMYHRMDVTLSYRASNNAKKQNVRVISIVLNS